MSRNLKRNLCIILTLILIVVNMGYSVCGITSFADGIKNNPLSNTYRLLNTEKKLTIGYLGGSITLGTSAERDGGSLSLSYVNRITDWFKANFSEAEIEAVNAGVSDTATNFGLFRLRKTLMNEDGHDMPDLVFVEFTVNDWTYDTQTAEDLEKQVESLYLNILKCNPYAEIVCVVTQESLTGTTRKAHLNVCEHYGVPLVDVGVPLLAAKTAHGHAQESDGNYYYTVDNLHPSWRGYQIYFNEIENNVLNKYLKNITVTGNSLYSYGNNLPVAKNEFLITEPEIITADAFKTTGQYSIKNSPLNCEMYGTGNTISRVAITSSYLNITGNTVVEADFNSNTLGVMFMLNNSGINMTYSIDGGVSKTLKVDSDNFGWQMYAHPQVFMLAHGLSEGKHTARLTFNAINLSTAVNVNLGGLLVNDYSGITADTSVQNGSIFIKRAIADGSNKFTVTVTPNENMQLKSGSLKYTYGGQSYPVITRSGAADKDGKFDKNSESQCTSFEFSMPSEAEGMVVTADFTEAGSKNIAVVGTSVNTASYKLRFRSRAARTYIKDNIEYKITDCGTMLFKEAQTDLEAAFTAAENGEINGKIIKCTGLFDRCDDYYEYVCCVNFGSAGNAHINDDYYAYAYAVYESEDGSVLRLYSDDTVNHSYSSVYETFSALRNLPYNTGYDGDYYTLRNGLKNTARKLNAGDDITIAFMGGSITYGIGTESLEYSFRNLIENWMEEQYGVNVTGINAAIPSACSALGAYCVDANVLSYNPDLVFVEYAINDRYSVDKYNTEDMSRNMETIVRKIRKYNKNCDIVFLYTTASDVSASTPLFAQAKIHEEIAEYYGVTSINIGYGLRESRDIMNPFGSDAIVERWHQYFMDGCHTNNNGNRVYADIITDCIESAVSAANAGVSSNIYLPEQLNKELLDNVTYIETADISLDKCVGYNKSSDRFGLYSEGSRGYVYTDTDSNEFVYTFHGTSFGILGPTDREYKYSVDGGKWQTYRFNSHPQPLVKGLKNGKHTIRIRVNGAASSRFSIAALLIG